MGISEVITSTSGTVVSEKKKRAHRIFHALGARHHLNTPSFTGISPPKPLGSNPTNEAPPSRWIDGNAEMDLLVTQSTAAQNLEELFI